MPADLVGIRISVTGAAAGVKQIQSITDALTEMGGAAVKASGQAVGAMDTLSTSTKAMAGEIDAANTTIADSYARVGVSSDAAAVSSKASGAAVASGTGVASKGMLKFGVVAAAVGYGLVKAVDNANNFGAAMTRLQTQAQVPQSQLGTLSSGILNLSRQVGFSPTSLAESAYHVESAFQKMGISAPHALNLVKVAAQGAQIGGADLVDVTNALNAVVVSGIKGAQNFQQAMGAVNATVGAGDMTMQNYTDEMKTGLLATAKNVGLTLTDVNAATAVFGDNLMRGTQAATYLKQLINVSSSPSKEAVGILAQFGISQYQLGTDMRGPNGLLTMIQDLHNHTQAYLKMLESEGVPAKSAMAQVAAMVSEAFGRSRGSASVLTLMNQIPRLIQSYTAIQKGATDEQKDWNATQQTAAQQARDLRGAWGALEITIGKLLTPAFVTVEKGLAAVFGFFAHNKTAAEVLAVVLGTVLVGALLGIAAALQPVIASMIALDIAGAPIWAIVAVLTAVGVAAVLLATHWHEVWTDVKQWTLDGVTFVKDHIYLLLGAGPIGGLMIAAIELGEHWKQVWDGMKSAAQDGVNGIIHIINGFIRAWNAVFGWVHHINTIGTLGGGGAWTGTGQHTANADIINIPGHATGGITNGPMAIVGEGNRAHPEVVVATDPAYRQRNLGLWSAAGRMLGVPGFASGGIIGDITSGLSDIGNAVTGGASSLWSDLTGVLHGVAAAAAKPMEQAALGFANLLPPGIFRNLATGLITAIYDAITGGGASVSGTSAAALARVPASVSGNAATAQRMAAARGWTGQEWNALYQVGQRESGWNQYAQNPSSGAYGIPQALPGSKMASAGADWQTNPVTQITWMLNYIKGRYGDPIGAWAHEMSAGWYAKGGILPVATYDTGGYLPTGPSIAINNTGSPEFVPGPGRGSGDLTVNVVMSNKTVGQAVIKNFNDRLARR